MRPVWRGLGIAYCTTWGCVAFFCQRCKHRTRTRCTICMGVQECRRSRDMEQIFEVAATITPLDTVAMEQAHARQEQLTKPPGSLGRLEEIAVQMAGITRQPIPTVKRKAVIVMAADHGVAVEGVSAYPSAVTPQMVLNFLHGGAAINALARHAGAEVVIVDVGVAADLDHPGLLLRNVARGTAHMESG